MSIAGDEHVSRATFCQREQVVVRGVGTPFLHLLGIAEFDASFAQQRDERGGLAAREVTLEFRAR